MSRLSKPAWTCLAIVVLASGGALAQGGATGAGRPPAPPPALRAIIGEYGGADHSSIVFERDGRLVLGFAKDTTTLRARGANRYAGTTAGGDKLDVRFVGSRGGKPARMIVGGDVMSRRQLGPESGSQLVVTPVRPLADLQREALAASPPAEKGPFQPTDLVELVTLDPTIKLEIRYATSHNLFGAPFYSQARAFLQRPAAEALVRANAALKAKGFGLLIHDGYRPWYVTKMFWEAAPVEKRIFVADPAEGSKHNRGAAVDLTLYELKTGKPVEMVSTYDETTARAAADYPGGTSLQRWRRGVLRGAMEEQRFTVNPTEWWHFDYADWRSYAIGNLRFEEIR